MLDQPTLAAFFAFMREREAIRLRRAAGEPGPWTQDPILREFKFTNVRRHHDRTTQHFRQIYEQWYGAGGQAAQLLNCAAYRYFGTTAMANELGWMTEFRSEHFHEAAVRVRAVGRKVFTSAYVITMGGNSGDKVTYVVDTILHWLWEAAEDLIAIVEDTNSWEQVADSMRHLEGFGGSGFMVKEVLLDTMLCPGFWPDGGPADRDTWTPVGPGARRGVLRLLGLPHTDRIGAEAARRWIVEIQGLQGRAGHWPAAHGKLSATDIQFQLCEFDKYERARLGQGRPKARFKSCP